MLCLGVVLQLAKIPLQVTICIRIAVSKVYRTVIMLKLYTEGQGIIMTGLLLPDGILIVANVLACSLPTLTAKHDVFL